MAPAKKVEPNELMIVNDALDEECRIAIIQDNHLEELYTERTATATNVGNIYKGRVTNVEPAIQAAFIDFGEGQNGFLHISDLHPRYFPGQERTERVGKKIPRHQRPLIQEALRRGDEAIVQVLKEGLGTKGPTLTSYLSIPGRLLVAMPGMDRVGVSRKVEDDEKRRKMRQILDSLDLPKDFGFILRTAGFDRTKTELKRDVAYLMRLWKLMEQRRQSSKGACELYTESDLLIRTIRDALAPTVKAIIVDTESAQQRASNFLRVAAPRSAPEVILYCKPTPIFHAFDIERQIELIHSREVPLPSGGRLVIEQTEALVAIDVNSGKSRSARDSETNAFQTNCEAVDEICRQLRLRDLGGLIINDLIDMHSRKNRKLIEERFTQNLKSDRAKSTVLRISEFGLVEMTRQRMRPSLRKSHFVPCQHCHGLGELKSPDTVGSDATRHVGYLMQFERVRRVEVVCSPKVASVMLSTKRRELVRLEDYWNKRIDVRVSDAIAMDRVDFYAYDDRNADIAVDRLEPPRSPSLKELEKEAAEFEKQQKAKASDRKDEQASRSEAKSAPDGATSEVLGEADGATVEDGQPKRKRRRRGRRSRSKQEQPVEATGDKEPAADQSSSQQDGKQPKRMRKPVRVHMLAKELGVPSREIIDRCEPIDEIEVKNHMSSVTHLQAEVIREWFDSDSDDTPNALPADRGDDAQPEAKKKSRTSRRGKRGGKKRRGRGRKENVEASSFDIGQRDERADDDGAATKTTEIAGVTDKKKRRSRRRRKAGGESSAEPASDASDKDAAASSDGKVATSDSSKDDAESPSQSGRGRRKRGRGGRVKATEVNGAPMHEPDKDGDDTSTTKQAASSRDEASGKELAVKPKPRRRLYRNRSRVSPTAREQAERTSDS